jgi:hypothetical protein
MEGLSRVDYEVTMVTAQIMVTARTYLRSNRQKYRESFGKFLVPPPFYDPTKSYPSFLCKSKVDHFAKLDFPPESQIVD